MDSILRLKKSNCKNCYKCIRHCPVKSIKFSEGQANIINDDCILCGRCFVACPQNAKEIRNDIDVVKSAIKSGRKIIASVAPSFISDFCVENIYQFELLLKKLGFSSAYETALGAQVVKKKYEIMIKEKETDVIISSCCHTVNVLIQKYYPDALKSLAKVVTPMHAHSMMIKQDEPEAFVVFIGPCISKKDELKLISTLDCVLTFDEIFEWLQSENISIEESEVSTEDAYRSRFFPKAGGIIASMDTDDSSYDYFAVDGIENCIEVIKNITSGNLSKCFIEMSACEGGCINGPATKKFRENRLDSIRRIDLNAGKNNKKDLDFTYNITLKKQMDYTGVHQQMPVKEAIREILKQMGKTLPEHELNCQSCGYNTCYDKAVAIYQGKADLTMCLPFLKEKAESFSDKIINNTPNAIIAIDDDLNIVQMNVAACKMFNLPNAKGVLKTSIETILNPSDLLYVLETGKFILENKIYLAEYGKFVEESIVYDKEYHICILILKDITERETAQEQKNDLCLKTVEIADKVIENQMRVVQEIASLLGETTAQTQIALTKLKDTMLK